MEPTTVTVTVFGSPIKAPLASVIVTVAVFSSPSSSDGSELATIVSSALALPPNDTAPPEIALPFCSSEMLASATHPNCHATYFVTLHAARKEVNRFTFSLVDVDALGRERNGRRLLAAQDGDRCRLTNVNAAAFKHLRRLCSPPP